MGGTVIKSHPSLEHAVIPDGALEHGLDTPLLQPFLDVSGKLAYIIAVKNPALIKAALVICTELRIGTSLQQILLGPDSPGAPLKGVAVAGPILGILKYIGAAHLQTLPQKLQHAFNGLVHLL